MKIFFPFITVVLIMAFTGILSPTYGQEWQKHEIDTEINKPVVVCAADVDDDNDLDLVAAGEQDDDVVWYENLGGTPISWTKHIIDGNLDAVICVCVADIDGDGDQDIAATGLGADDVVWYENLGGIPISWTKHIIDGNLDGARDLYIAYIDVDDTLDVVVTGYNVDDVVWYENDHPNWPKHTIDGNLDGANDIITADIDGDSNQDVIVTGYYANKVVWYNNLLTDIGILSERVSTIYELFSNFPNPFNPSTKIKFALPKPETVTIEVYNIIGQKIQTLLNKPMPAGYHEVEFNGQNLSSGIYLYRIEAGGWKDVKKMILLR